MPLVILIVVIACMCSKTILSIVFALGVIGLIGKVLFS
jgi:hypothetical protein